MKAGQEKNWETCTTPPRKTTMPQTYDGMTINKVRSWKPLQPIVSKRNTSRTVLTQKVTSFKREKKHKEERKLPNFAISVVSYLTACLFVLFVCFFLAKGVSSVRWKSWHSVSAWSRNGKCTSSQEHAFYLWCGNWKFLFTHFCFGKFNYKIILFLVINL